MKRKLFILCILLGLVGAHATAYDFKVDGIYYNIISASESTCEVTKGDVAYSGNIKIPATVNHENQTFSVTKIGDYTFSNSYSLTSITIPKSVVSIGTDAFFCIFDNLASIIVEEGNTVYDSRNNCNAIIEKETNKLILGCKSTIIPNSVTAIKSFAFYRPNFSSITIPSSVTNIEHSAFACVGYNKLTSITVEEENTVYDSRNNCNAIIEKETNKLLLGCQNTTIPNTVEIIGTAAFDGCWDLQEIIIPNSVVSIEHGAFYYCTHLANVNISNSVTTIGSSAFCYCSSLTSITIPNSVTTIGTGAFSDCSSLTSIIIPNSVTTIEGSTFSGCSSLTNVTIPNSVTSIGAGAFSGCNNIPTEDNIRYAGTWAVEVTNKAQTTYTLRDNTTGVTPYLFSNCTNLQSINIPNSVTKIGSEAFSGCSSLIDITISNSVKEIEHYTFSGCSNLQNITLGNSIEVIRSNAFSDCTNLNHITIPYSVKEIETGGVLCSNLTTVKIESPSVVKKGYFSQKFGEQVKEYIIGDKVNTIGYCAFQDCSDLTNVVIPNSIKKIEDVAFLGCRSLTNINLPNSVTSIGSGAFQNCAKLTNITIPDSVRNIEDATFRGCSNLTNVSLPTSIDSIGWEAFYECPKLSSITFNSNPFVNDEAIPADITIHLNLSDEEATDFCADNANTYADVTYERNLLAGKYGTITLPFTPDAESTGTFVFYQLSSANEKELMFDEVAQPQANTPYLYTLREGKSATQITGGQTTIASTINNPETVNNMQMIGSFTNQTIATGEDASSYYYAYTSADNKLHKILQELTVKPYRAYFKNPAMTTFEVSSYSVYLRGANGIQKISIDDIEDFDHMLYDMSGRPVSNPVKGNIYIKNGKKLIY